MRLTIADAQHLRGHAKAIADPTQAAVDHVVDTEVASGDQRIDRGAVITQDATRRSHDETLHVAQSRDQRISETDTEILITRIFSRRTQDAEGKYGDRLLVSTQLTGNRRQRGQTMVQPAQHIVEARVTVQWIELRIDSNPQHLRVTRVVRSFKQVECFFRTVELARHECEMVRRNV